MSKGLGLWQAANTKNISQDNTIGGKCKNGLPAEGETTKFGQYVRDNYLGQEYEIDCPREQLQANLINASMINAHARGPLSKSFNCDRVHQASNPPGPPPAQAANGMQRSADGVVAKKAPM